MKHRTLAPALAALTLGLTGCAGDEGGSDAEEFTGTADEATEEADADDNAIPVERSTDLVDPEGSRIGTATFNDTDLGVEVHVVVRGMAEGFHPVGLYELGVCEPASAAPEDPATVGDFLSAGTILGLGTAVDTAPAGAMPPILVTAEGVGELTSLTGPTDLDELLAGDGTTLIIQETLDLGADDVSLIGEGGSRVACGAIGG